MVALVGAVRIEGGGRGSKQRLACICMPMLPERGGGAEDTSVVNLGVLAADHLESKNHLPQSSQEQQKRFLRGNSQYKARAECRGDKVS